jgi:hypothetical protein
VRPAVVFAVASTLPALVACGLTADFSGLQGGTRDAAAADATSADVVDGGMGGDGAPDAGFCASQTTPVHFCADFDESATVAAGWSSTDIYQGSYAGVDVVYFSSPGSFLSSLDANSSPGSARLVEDVPTDTPHVHVAFEMLLPPLAAGNLEVCTLHQPVSDGTTYGVFYKYQDGNLLVYVRTLGDDGGEIDVVNQIGPPPSGWLHVEIDCDVSESGTIVVKHDGVVVVNDTNVDTSTMSRASMFVELGYYSFDPVSVIAHFDNVIVDWL